MDTPLKASAIVLGAIKNRIQLLAACRPEGAGGNGSNSTNVLVWLQSVLPGVQKIVGQVDGAGISRDERQHLVLESDAEATDISSNGSNGSLS